MTIVTVQAVLITTLTGRFRNGAIVDELVETLELGHFELTDLFEKVAKVFVEENVIWRLCHLNHRYVV